MAKTESDAQWIEIDVTTLAPELQAQYEAYKVAQRAAAELRTQFERSVNEASDLPSRHKLVFGYRFGKLSAAVVKDESKPAQGSKAKQSLADFIASQAQSGRRV